MYQQLIEVFLSQSKITVAQTQAGNKTKTKTMDYYQKAENNP